MRRGGELNLYRRLSVAAHHSEEIGSEWLERSNDGTVAGSPRGQSLDGADGLGLGLLAHEKTVEGLHEVVLRDGNGAQVKVELLAKKVEAPPGRRLLGLHGIGTEEIGDDGADGGEVAVSAVVG